MALLRLGTTAGVDNDTETLGLLLGDTGELEFGDGEAAALWWVSMGFEGCRVQSLVWEGGNDR